jgi:hypothetical protein
MSLNIESVLKAVKDIKADLNDTNKPPEQITFENGAQIIPLNLFHGTRQFLSKVVIQINQTYEHSCYDACAVMIRRMLEMLIILTFENYGLESLIKDASGNYFMLSGLIPIYMNQSKWTLSRNTKSSLGYVKDLGDFSAHKLHYNAQRGDIDKILDKYHLRTIFEEMLYHAKLKS